GSAFLARSLPPAPATTPVVVPDSPMPVAPRRPPPLPPASNRHETRSSGQRTAATPATAADSSTRWPLPTSDAAPPHPASGSPRKQTGAATEAASEQGSAPALALPPVPEPAECLPTDGIARRLRARSYS